MATATQEIIAIMDIHTYKKKVMTLSNIIWLLGTFLHGKCPNVTLRNIWIAKLYITISNQQFLDRSQK